MLEHFLHGVLQEVPKGDVERYLQGMLDTELTAAEAVQRLAPERSVATFEEVKQWVLATAQEREKGAGS